MNKTDFPKNYDLMPQASMTLDMNLVFKNANAAYCKAVRRKREDIVGRYVFEAFDESEERVEFALNAFRQTLAGEITKVELTPFQIVLPNGELQDRLWDVENQPLYSETGEIVGLVQYCEDVTDRERLRKERDLVTAELMHRVRNTMSLVQAVANQTGRVSTNIEDFLAGFSGRLMAMSRNFTALSDANWKGLSFEEILRSELSPYLEDNLERISISGDDLPLTVKATKDASMIFHELVTNASKYGFLTVPEGRLEVEWHFENDTLYVTWNEFGLSDLTPPSREGFGFKMIKMFPNLTIEKHFASDGLKLQGYIQAERVMGQIEFTPVPTPNL